MTESKVDSLQHPPQVVVAFVRRLIDGHRTGAETERRTQVREAITIPVAVQPMDADFQIAGDIFSARTKDISTGGIGLIHSERVATKYLQIRIAARDGEEMSLLVQVKHCTPCGQQYHVGGRFVVDWSLWRDNETREISFKGSARDNPMDVRSARKRR